MNPDFMKEIEKSDKLATLVREFPGKNCGNTECNELCAEALKIAKLSARKRKLYFGKENTSFRLCWFGGKK